MSSAGHIATLAAHIALIVTLAVASYTDARQYKVYNWLTVPAVLLGVALGAVGGSAGLLHALGGFAAGFCIGLLYYVFFRCGAGDAKLLMAVGALCGAQFLVGTALYGAIAALPMALFVMWRRGVFGYTLSNFARNAVRQATGVSGDWAAGSRAGKMPYAVPIAIGAALTWFLYGWAGMTLGGG